MQPRQQPELAVANPICGSGGITYGVEIRSDGSDFGELEVQVVLAPEEVSGFWIRSRWEKGDDLEEINIPIDALPALRSMLKHVDRRIRAMRNGLVK